MAEAIDRFFAEIPPTVTAATEVEKLLLREYGSLFVSRGGAERPSKIVFADQADVAAFQGRISVGKAVIGDLEFELQKPAMDALTAARAVAASSGLSITPRGPDSARRDYDGTVSLWKSRVEPALDHWVREGRLATQQAEQIRSLTPFEQVSEVLRLEGKGIWFAKDLAKSIIYSVAPPGTSQHLSMLAFDVAEFADPRVRALLAAHGWFQTVVSDLPHFTYLGVREDELKSLGLKRIDSGGQEFWVPDI